MGKEGEEIVDEGADYLKRKAPLEEVEGRKGKGKRLLEEDETYVVEDHGYNEAEKANRGDNASTFFPRNPAGFRVSSITKESEGGLLS